MFSIETNEVSTSGCLVKLSGIEMMTSNVIGLFPMHIGVISFVALLP